MTESNKKQPLSPAEYLRLVARPRHKLYAYVELIGGLMEIGFTDYRIWRYLDDEYGVKIGRTTAHRFCTALRTGRIPGANAGGALPGAVATAPLKPTKGSLASPVRPPAPDTHVRRSDPGDTPENAASEHSPQVRTSDAVARGTFAQSNGKLEPTIEPSRGPQHGEPYTVIKTFKASTPEARQRLREFHKTLKPQPEGIFSKGPTNDEHDEQQT
ncbi:hypothetical protein [Paraburkholderia youngii]|uniref:hypothetical protein n=1 Tax=Paraburkholderia youngii TaxID=2782701 RepID=UPI003D2152C2